MDKETLLKFIAKAHRHTYAAPKEVRQQHRVETPLLEGHKEYEYIEGDLRYYDSYAGSQWAPGKEEVFLNGQPIWCMSYQGQHNPDYDEEFYQEQVFPFLKRALMDFEDEMPFRGPEEFEEGDFRYTFKIETEPAFNTREYDYFKGQERVTYKGELVFFQDVMGSLIK